MRSALWILPLLLLALPRRTEAQTGPIDSFEGADPLVGWSIENGREFPGAMGSLRITSGVEGSGLSVLGDFNAGGNYVQAVKDFEPLREGSALQVWHRSDSATVAAMRVVDSNGQSFQYQLPRKLTALEPSAWTRSSIELAATDHFWGGPADGRFSGTLKAVTLVAGRSRDRTYEPTTEMLWDELSLIEPPAPQVDPQTTPVVPLPGSDVLGDRLVLAASAGEPAASLDYLIEAGAGFLRIDVDWAGSETNVGSYDFSAIEPMVEAASARGLKVHFVLGGTHPVHADAPGEAPRSATTRAAFAAFADALAQTFAGRHFIYEIWGRPDGTWTPTPNAADFASLVGLTAARIRSADDTARIVSGAMQRRSLQREVIAAGITAHVDGFGLHKEDRPEFLVNESVELSEWMATAGMQRPLFDIGMGVSTEWFGMGDTPQAHEAQARELVREVLLAWALGQPLVAVGTLRDEGADATVARNRTGLLTPEGAAKPALAALNTLTRAVADRTMLGAYALDPTTLYGLKLQGADDVVLVLWSSARRSHTDVLVPPPTRAVDLYGAPVSTTLGDGRSGVRVEEARGPVYLTYPRVPPEPGADTNGSRGPLLGWACSSSSTFPGWAVLAWGLALCVRRRPRALDA